MPARLARALVLAPVLAAALAPLGAARAQQPPMPHPLGPVTLTAPEPFASIMSVRPLSGGRLLVNDLAGRTVVMLDARLARTRVVADSTSATGTAYGGRAGALVPYRGDSTLFVDATSLSMMVIDGNGKLGRVLALPVPDQAGSLTAVGGGVPGMDRRGRLVHRSTAPVRFQPPARGAAGPPTPVFPDSAAIVAIDLPARRVDTVAMVRIPTVHVHVLLTDDGRPRGIAPVVNPLPITDDWVVTSDGRIAVVRGHDYHVEWYDADRVPSAPTKIPFDWQRLDDEGKSAYIDSTRIAMERARAALGALPAGDMTDSARRIIDESPAAALAQIQMPTMGGGPMSDAPPPRRPANTPRSTGLQLPPLEFVPPSELPDYKPPFAAGGVRADADGNIWVREIPTKPYPGPVYDVIDRHGRLVDRVIVPAGTAIAGFGPGGVVYLGVRDATGIRLQRASVR